MQAFKYAATHGLTTLRQERIKVSLASELNDPFELSPRIDPAKFTVEIVMQVLRQDHLLDEAYAKEKRRKGFTNKKRYKEHYLKTLRQRAEALIPKIPANVEAARDDFAATFSARWRLFCTSVRRDSILMWSHYAGNHTGAVIGFDLNSPPFSKLGSDCVLPVSYSNEKPDFFFRPASLSSFEKALRAVVRTKASEWSYEEEVRVMFPASMCVDSQFIRFPSTSVTSVFLGARMSVSVRQDYLLLLSEPRYSHVSVFNSVLAKDQYSLEFRAARPGA